MTTRALKLAASIAWAISAQWLSTILTIANREGPGPEAVAAELGRPLDNTQTTTNRNGVAVIPVVGPIFRRANLFSMISGATSVEGLATELNIALDAEEITAIVLDIDSPGGEVSGVHELASMIYAARGRKPVVAYIGGTGASAAYWLASAADKIVCDATALVGSIGVVMAVPDPAAEKATEIEIVSSQSPSKRLDVTSKDGRAEIQATVDDLAAVFIADVARNRGLSAADVPKRFGAGGVMVGDAARAAGMVDELGSLEGVIAQLSPPSSSSPAPVGVRATASNTTARALSAAKGTPMSTANTPAAEAPAAPPPADDKDKPAEQAAMPADDVKNCGACKAVCAGSAKFCAGCGAAFPEKKPEEDDDEPPSSEDPDAVVAGLKAISGAKSGRLAVAAAMKWKHAATVDLPKARAEALDVIAATLKASGKLTPALEKDLRSLASLDHGSFLASAMELANGKPIAGLEPQTKEPKLQPTDATALVHNGKRFEQLSFKEQADLQLSDRATYDAMLSDAVHRGALRG